VKFRVFEIKTGTGVTDDADFVVDSSGRLCDVDNFCRLVEVDPKKCRVEYIPEWVKITDDPKTWPENGSKVLISRGGEIQIGVTTYTKEGGWNHIYFRNYIGLSVYASHWMPIPQGPKEEA